MEQWRPIPGWENWYEVSDQGRVRSVDRVVEFSDGRVREYRGKVLSQYLGSGYWKVTLKRNGQDRRVGVHVLVATAFIGPRPKGMEICHGDGNPLNNARENLRYDTSSGNRADAFKHGTVPLNEQVRLCKLSREDVRAIRERRGTATCKQLAKEFGTSPAHVCNIQRGNRRNYA